jgi:hypothetical protein
MNKFKKPLYRMRFIPLMLIIFLVVMLAAPLMLMAEATAPDLGAAESFSVLAALSTSAATTTTICGDLGLSPGLESSRTGDWVVGGSEYFGTGGLYRYL